MGATDKDRLIKEIAQDLYLREDVVRDVLSRFQDISMEKIVNEREYKLPRFFTIGSSDYKGYTNSKGVVPPHTRLSIKLSESIRRLFKMKQAGVTVTRDNWRELLSSSSGPENSLDTRMDEVWQDLMEED